MKKVFLLLISFFILSCHKENENNTDNNQNNIVQNVESSSSSFRFKRGSSLLDAIYYESIKNDEKLKSIDEKINSIYSQSMELISKKKEIFQKSNEYYSDANLEINGINDSILKKQLLSLVNNSSQKYDKKVELVKKDIKQIEQNNTAIQDFYIAFKIRKTLPEIEKFQNQNPLKTDDLEKMIAEQKQFIEKVKQLK